MQVITSFDSTPPGETKATPTSYSDILKALMHSREVAENAFARVAKQQLHQLILEVPKIMAMADEYRQFAPVWISDESVVVWVGGKEEEVLEQSNLLSELVDNLAGEMLKKGDTEKSLVLIDPLSIRIQQVSSFHYRCGIKQKRSRND